MFHFIYFNILSDHLVSTGDRIAQLIFEKIGIFEIIQVDELDDVCKNMNYY